MQFYRKNIKPYALFRIPAEWLRRCWRVLGMIFRAVFFHGANGVRVMTLIGANDFCKKCNHKVHKLLDAEIIHTPPPLIFPSSGNNTRQASHYDAVFPPISITLFNSTVINGGSNLFQVGRNVIYHDLFDVKNDSTSEELWGRAIIYPEENKIQWLSHDKSPYIASEAASFVDACAGNYAHWMTEVLPRIAMFCAEEKIQAHPIIINSDLHPNIMSSLYAVIGLERSIIICR
ncbi:MAG: hypothetical protein QS748_13390 [Candidatus Endonucleobacter bathymodioli]|uniref:Uncharacterized protein n=1 Tax=Candidatus Endonucleibacter bathymodioli TaxID=539814 RepID=A0AA90STY7_9GAMM|nr:hypothetical protein [Candidatus Endonucleobacter bathymodioli]